MLDFINEYTNGKYYISINNIKKSKQFNNLLIQGEFRKAKTNEFKDFYKKNKKEFYYYWLYLKFPKIFKIYEKIKLFIMNIGRKKIYPVK